MHDQQTPRRMRRGWRRPVRTLGLVLGAVLIATHGWAGQQTAGAPVGGLAELGLEALMNIEVTSASKRPQPLSEVSAALFVVTQEDIRRSGATSVPEVLRLVPGMQVARIDSNKWAISSRGFSGRFADKLLVLMDGRSLYTPLFSGVFWDVQDTLMEDIDRIEVIRGPGATLWGANAVNGVINIITKNARDTQGFTATAGGGNEERGFGSLRYGGEFASGQGQYRLYGKYFDREGARSLFSSELTADDWNMSRSGFRVDWQGSGPDSLAIQGDGYVGQSGETVRAALIAPPHSSLSNHDQNVSGGNLLVKWQRQVSDDHTVTAQVYYDRTEREAMLFGATRDTIDFEVQENVPLDRRHNLIWGAGFRYSRDDIRNTFSIALSPNQRGDRLYSGFVQDNVSLVEDVLRLTVGTKVEHNSYSGFEIQPNVRVAWTAPGQQSVWGSVARAVRTPSRADHGVRLSGLLSPLAVGDPLNPFPAPIVTAVLGNEQVEAEGLIAYEAGYRVQASETLGVDVAVFLNQYDSLRTVGQGAPMCNPSGAQVVRDPLCVLFATYIVAPLYLGNEGDDGRYGLEVSADWRPLPWWRVKPAYSYLQTRNPAETTNLLDRFAAGQNPVHQLSARSSIDMPRNVEFDAWLRYVDRLPAIDIDSYLTLDTRVAWTLGTRLEIAVVGQNLLEARHTEFLSELGDILPSAIERSAYLQFRWAF
jgi:iron complex outermembrane receptor protein